MKKQFLLIDDSGNGQVSIEISGGASIVINHPKEKTIDVSRLDEVTRQKLNINPGDFKLDRGKVVKHDKPKQPLAHQ